MKLITLNTWAGIVYEPLIKFISKKSSDIDVFCFQEIFHTETDNTIINLGARGNLHNEILSLLPEHKDFFSSQLNQMEYGRIPVEYDLSFGVDTFIKKNVEFIQQYEKFVHGSIDQELIGEYRTTNSNMQVNRIKVNGKEYTIFNFHGLWNGQGKGDAPERIEQSKRVRAEMDRYTGPKILCGDFNLLPETESIKILEEGMRNLVLEYGYSSTRSSHYTKPLKFADYILVSPEVEVIDFKVLSDEVSDHLPLYIEFK